MKISTYRLFGHFLVVLILFICILKADAQKIELGLRSMPIFSSFRMMTSSGERVNGQTTLGYGVGGLLAFNYNGFAGVQGEIIYSSISQKLQESDVVRKINLRYIRIPVLLSLNTGKSRLANLNIVVGPQIGINVGSSLRVTGNNTPQTPDAVLSVKKGDIGFAYGAGLDFALTPSRTFRLSLGFRGVYGLFDVGDDRGSIPADLYYIFDRTHIKTNSFYTGVSFLFL